MSAIILSKITREHYPATLDPSTEPDALTLGQAIDKMLVEAAERGETVVEVAVHLEEDEWARFRERVPYNLHAEREVNELVRKLKPNGVKRRATI